MATNFPTGLDTIVELGGLFVNVVAPADPTKNIDAGFRNNHNDATMAIEARIGITNSAVTSSLSWATMSIGGTDNQGLRFAASGVQWPGAVGESGIFLDSGTVLPAFHRAGEAVGTFYPLSTAGVSLQTAYGVGNTIVTAGGNDVAISGSEDFSFEASATSRIIVDGATNDRTSLNGIIDVDIDVNADGVQAVDINMDNAVGHNGYEFGGITCLVTDNSDLDDTDIIYCYKAKVDMQGDGPAAGGTIAWGVGFLCDTPVFGGANNYGNIGLYIKSGYDAVIRSESISAEFVTAAGNETFEIVGKNIAAGMTSSLFHVDYDSNNASGTGVHSSMQLAAAGGLTGGTTFYSEIETDNFNAAGAVYGYKLFHATNDTDAAAADCYGFFGAYTFDNGAGTNDTGPTVNGVYIDVPETLDGGGAYKNNDGTYAFDRWGIYVNAGESTLRRTLFTSVTNLNKALVYLDQNDIDSPFYAVDGSYNAAPASGNITDLNGVGAVVGPTTDVWVFEGLFRVQVEGAPTFTGGAYWVPFYSLV